MRVLVVAKGKVSCGPQPTDAAVVTAATTPNASGALAGFTPVGKRA
jgi:hypothetical protein